MTTRPLMPDTFPETIDQAPYPTEIDALAELEAAFECAAENGKRVLVNLGANWCPDARLLCAVMVSPDLEGFLSEAYEIVRISVGRYDQNMDLVAEMGFANGLEGVPTILICDTDGSVLNSDAVYRWRTARQSTSQQMADYFFDYSGQDATE